MIRQTPSLLLVNGNSTVALTERLARHAADRLEAGYRLSARTALSGPAYIRNRADVRLAAPRIVEAIAAAISEGLRPDACLIACFGEPGIAEARAAMPVPVIGMAEASVACALQLGPRYAIVTVGSEWPAILSDYLASLGLFARCSGIVPIEGDAMALAADPDYARRQIALAVDVACRQGADSVILGGAAVAGLAEELVTTCRVPLIDSFLAGLAQARALADLRLARWDCDGS
jgi:Asp/Glu/hydantoin racemase